MYNILTKSDIIKLSWAELEAVRFLSSCCHPVREDLAIKLNCFESGSLLMHYYLDNQWIDVQ